MVQRVSQGQLGPVRYPQRITLYCSKSRGREGAKENRTFLGPAACASRASYVPVPTFGVPFMS